MIADLFVFGVIGFALLLFTCLVDIVLGRFEKPARRWFVTQGPVTYICESPEDVVALTQQFAGVSTVTESAFDAAQHRAAVFMLAESGD